MVQTSDAQSRGQKLRCGRNGCCRRWSTAASCRRRALPARRRQVVQSDGHAVGDGFDLGCSRPGRWRWHRAGGACFQHDDESPRQQRRGGRGWAERRARGAPDIERFAAKADLYLSELASALREGTYRPQAVKRVDIPKGDGKLRPSSPQATQPASPARARAAQVGIPTVKDRRCRRRLRLRVQQAVRLVIACARRA